MTSPQTYDQIAATISEYNCRKTKPALAREYADKFNRALTAPVAARPPITIADLDDSLAYQGKTNMYRPSLHIGQRKLAVEEVQFIVEALEKYPNIHYVVYAGAAPSVHMGYVSALFAGRIKFLLVDPADFHINLDYKAPIDIRVAYAESSDGLVEWFAAAWCDIAVYQGFFTEEIARDCGKYLQDYLFMSDIRTCSNDASVPYDYDVIHNLASQFVWLHDMAAGVSPRAYMLKYRAPYYYMCEQSEKMLERPDPIFVRARDLGIDFVADYRARRINYLAGEYYIQSWAGFTSSETRLCYFAPEIVTRAHISAGEYEDKMFYYNTIPRVFKHYENKHACVEIGFDHCADCAREAFVWEEYARVVSSRMPVIKHVKYLTRAIHGRSFLVDKSAHGYFFDDKNAWMIKLGECLAEHDEFMQDQIRKKKQVAARGRGARTKK